MKDLLLVLCLSILSLSSCNSKIEMDNTGITFDALTGEYDIASLGLRYVVPRPELSIVADPENLPENIAMCVVDTQAMVSVSLLNLVLAPQREEQANGVISSIVQQENVEQVSVNRTVVEACEFLSYKGWKFIANMEVALTDDTTKISYLGCIFGNNAIVVTCPSDSVSEQFVQPYINALRKI